VDILDEYDGDVQTGISDINAYVEQRVQSAEELTATISTDLDKALAGR
jgi:hypothetical protein